MKINETIENNFKYHAPNQTQQVKYQELRQKGKELAYMMMFFCPDSRELSFAMEKVEEAIMWANASIARHEK